MRVRWILLLVIGLALSMAFPVYAAGVVGTGTAASCTEAAFDAALSGGGAITFSCGAAPFTLAISGSKTITALTTIDGGGLITLDGGGYTQIFYNNGASLTLQNMTIANARSIDGGAIMNDRGSLTLTNVRMNRNAAVSPGSGESGNGGAVYSTGGLLAIFNSRFTSNTADRRGGAIFVAGSSVSIDGGNFFGNRALRDDGGAIANGMNGVPGGVMFIARSSFSLNQAPLSGGAIFSANRGQVSTTETSFTANLANVGGGIAIFGDSTGGVTTTVTSERLNINETRFLTNVARYDGGAIYSDVPITITESVFQTNNATRDGGALWLADRTALGATITDTTFTRNRARRNGGGLYNITAHTIVERSLLASNIARADGGGVYTNQFTTSGFNLIVNNSTFNGNVAARGGGVFDASGVISTWLRYVTLNLNRAPEGASLHGLAIRVRSSIIANPVTGSNCASPVLSEGTVIQFPGASCGGLWTIDPLLLPLALEFGPTRVHPLMAGSPAIDAVPNVRGAAPGCGEPLDQRTLGRPYDGNGDGTAQCDVGAYEYGEVGILTEALTFATAAPTATLPIVVLPTPTITLPPAVRVDCQPFALTSPRDGLPNGVITFYWNAAAGATDYAVILTNEGGAQVAQFTTPAPNTNLSADVSAGAIGAGFAFTVEVQARIGGQPICRDSVRLLRESPNIPTRVPQCGNGIQEPGENQNLCPNGY